MKSVPGRLAGLVVVLGLAAAGCASHPAGSPAGGPSKPSAAPPAPVDNRAPQQIVLAAFPNETSPIYHYSITSADVTESGVIDAPDKIAEYTLTPQHYTNPSYTEVVTYLLTRKKSWLKVADRPAGAAGLPRKWMSFDPTRLTYGDGTPLVYSGKSAPLDAYRILEMSDEVSRTSPDHYRGTTNIGQGDFLTAAHIKALGAKAYAIPFTAVLDGQGRLLTVTMRVPAAGKFKADTTVFTFDGYGTAPVPKVPAAAEQTRAPSTLYRWFN